MATTSDVKKIYLQVVQDVCGAVREALIEEGYDEQAISELRSQWTNKIESAKALEPLLMSATDEATTRMNRRTTTNDHHQAGTLNKATAAATNMRPTSVNSTTVTPVGNLNPTYAAQGLIHPRTVQIPTATIGPSGGTTTFVQTNAYTLSQNATTMGNNPMRTSNQLDGTHDEVTTTKKRMNRKKKSPRIEIAFQVDGTGPPVTDDEDEDDDNDIEGNEIGDDLDDDDDDDGNDEGTEDSRPLCSDDDVSDDEPAELFETDNVVVCQYEKISRTKNKWRFTLKSGLMNINGRDFVFSKAIGDADW